MYPYIPTASVQTNVTESQLDAVKGTLASTQALVEEVTNQRDKARAEAEVLRTMLRNLKLSLQQDLADWAEQNLQAGDDDYNELNDLMINNDLEGLKRLFKVTVKVTYEFEVEVESTDEDSARDEVDNNIEQHIDNNVSINYPDYTEIDAEEA